MTDTADRRSAIAILRTLDAVFDQRDLAIALGPDTNDPERTATQYCWRWKKAGYIKAGGPRLGTFYNLIRDEDHERHRGELILKAIPRPLVVAGASALHHHGWTTQIPRQIELAVAVTRKIRSLPTIDDATLCARPVGWFAPVLATAQPGVDGLPTLSPEHALIEAIRMRLDGDTTDDLWRPDPDDISIDVDEDERPAIVDRLLGAADRMQVGRDAVLAYVAQIPGFEDVGIGARPSP